MVRPKRNSSNSTPKSKKKIKTNHRQPDISDENEPTLRISLEFRNILINNLNYNSHLLLSSTATTMEKYEQVELNEDLCRAIMNYKLQCFIPSKSNYDDSKMEIESSVVTNNKKINVQSNKSDSADDDTNDLNSRIKITKSTALTDGQSILKETINLKTVSTGKTSHFNSTVRPCRQDLNIQNSCSSYKERWMAELDLIPTINLQTNKLSSSDDLALVANQSRVRNQVSVNNLSDIRAVAGMIIMKEIESSFNQKVQQIEYENSEIDENKTYRLGTNNNKINDVTNNSQVSDSQVDLQFETDNSIDSDRVFQGTRSFDRLVNQEELSIDDQSINVLKSNSKVCPVVIVYRIRDVDKFFWSVGQKQFSEAVRAKSPTTNDIFGFSIVLMSNFHKRKPTPKNLDLMVRCSLINKRPDKESIAWSCPVDIELRLLNQLSIQPNISHRTQFKFSEGAEVFSIDSFATYAKVTDKQKGYLVNDMLIFEARITFI